MWFSIFFFFFNQKSAYEMRISDCSSDVCSSDLSVDQRRADGDLLPARRARDQARVRRRPPRELGPAAIADDRRGSGDGDARDPLYGDRRQHAGARAGLGDSGRSEEHTSELQSLMRISYAVFCLKKKTQTKT